MASSRATYRLVRSRNYHRGIRGLLAAFVGMLGTLVPKIVEQSRTVFFKIEHAEWQVEFDGLLRRTVGGCLWRRSFGNAADSRYQEALARYRSDGQTGSGIFAALPSWGSTMRARFDASRSEDAQVAANDPSRLRQFWLEQKSQRPQDIPLDFETFAKLSDARPRGEGEFRKAFTTQLQTLPDDQKNTFDSWIFRSPNKVVWR